MALQRAFQAKMRTLDIIQSELGSHWREWTDLLFVRVMVCDTLTDLGWGGGCPDCKQDPS